MRRARTLLLGGSIVAALLVAAPAQSDDATGFKGPGWYLLANALVWLIDSGPFSSQSDCNATAHGKSDYGDGNGYDCRYLSAESDLERVNGGG
jgi:hypothetical protein